MTKKPQTKKPVTKSLPKKPIAKSAPKAKKK